MSPITYLCIGLAASAFLLGCALGNRTPGAAVGSASLLADRSAMSSKIWTPRRAVIGMFVLLTICMAANAYAVQRFGALPLFASDPDQARFVLARELPGLVELLMALAKQVLVIGFIVAAVHRRALSRWSVAALTIMCLASGMILLAQGGRLPLLVAIAVGGLAAFMASNASRWWFLAAVLVLVLPILVVIPLLRETLSYGGQYFQSLTEFGGGGGLQFLSYPYAALSFNIQNLQLVLEHPDLNGQFGGLLQYAPFDKLFHLLEESPALPWHELLANWWVTGTALSTFYADFGWIGVVLESAAVGGLAMLSFHHMRRRRNELTWILYAYVAYVLAFTVYVWYPARPEIYFDVAVFVAFSAFASRRQARSG
ncbi:MAG: O-antigen polymerase [bacterium]